jgi:hypothetical protein
MRIHTSADPEHCLNPLMRIRDLRDGKNSHPGSGAKHPGSATPLYLVCGQDPRLHICTRDETGLVSMPTQLERTVHCNFTGDGKCSERG